ncbi:hypothetical protein NQ317_017481 [Molorchus minor]|uniref:Uncharacterized protein n=1 Tax=Molorchus minor TaxID=1323400 RepID=A0ABQ9JMA1_9CUCU|nr:hypothetical protein NQ317_017481 [Molorchus minor]
MQIKMLGRPRGTHTKQASYTIGLFWRTYTRNKLEEEDLYQVLSSHKSQNLGDELEKHIKEDINKHTTSSIYRILWSCYGKEYLFIGLVQLIMRMIVVTTIPMAISKIVLYFKQGQEEVTERDVYYYAASLIGINFINIIYLHNYLLTITGLGIRVRTAFCSLMYRKCLRLTPSALSDLTTGKIVTLMTKDVGAFETIILYGNDIWIGFAQAALLIPEKTIDVLRDMEDENCPTWSKDMFNPPLKINTNISDKIFGQVADLSSMDVRSSSSLSPPVSAALSEQTLRHALSVVIPLGITESAELHAAVKRIENLLEAEDIFEATKEISDGTSKIILKEVTVAIDEIDIIKNITTENLGYFLQLFNKISFLEKKLDYSRYQEVLRVCGLSFDVEFFKGGNNLIIGDKGINLSKGQKARINLARAVYKDSDIYLLDDCLTALDANVKEYVFRELMEKGKGKQFSKSTEIYQNDMKLNITENVNKSLEENISLSDTFDDENTRLLGKSENSTKENIYREVKKSGKVKGEVYNKYILYGGGYFFSSLIIIFVLMTQFSKSYTEKMVSNWVDLEQNVSQLKVNNFTISSEYEVRSVYSSILTLFSVLVLATTVLSMATALIFFNFTRRASQRLNMAMTEKIVNAVMTFFDNNLLGNILNRFSKDLATVDEQIPFVLYEFIEFLFGFCGIIFLIATVNLRCMVPVLVVLVILFFIRRFYMPTGRNLQRLDTATRSPIIGYLNATLEGLTTIRAFNAQSILTEEFDRHQDLYTSTNFTLKCCVRAFGFALDTSCTIFIAAVVGYFLKFDSGTSVGNVGLAITQSFMLSGLVQYGIRQWADLETKMTSVERILEYTNNEQEKKDAGLRPTMWPSDGKITYENVSLLYHGGTEVLKNMNFAIESKQKIGIVGRTGSGKTSIVSTLFRLYNFEGRITIDDVDIEDVSLEHLRKSIAIIPQDPILFTGTIRANIDPMNLHEDEEVWSAINKVNLRHLITSLDLQIKDSSSNFSEGQKQLFCLARAIVSKNKIIVMDEATANMDEETSILIHETMKQHFSSCTVITIAHRLHTVLNCDKVMVVESGQVVEYDDPNILLKNTSGVFFNMVKSSGLVQR